MGQKKRVSLSEVHGGTSLCEHEVRSDEDAWRARHHIKQVCRLLGLRGQAQTHVATASAELIRNALSHASGCTATLTVSGEQRRTLWITVEDRGPGIS